MKPASNLLSISILLLTCLAAHAQSPGDTIGYTQYDYQCNYPAGQRIAIDNIGGVHFVWLACTAYPENRNARYVSIDSLGDPYGHDLGPYGYPQIALTTDNQPGIVFNSSSGATYWSPSRQHTFDLEGLWPSIAIDSQNRVHVIYIVPGYIIKYVRSDNGGLSWSASQVVDSTELPSYMVTASRVSNKVALLYFHQDASQATTYLYYIQSANGVTWDWAQKINITPDRDETYLQSYDFDAVYDYNDNLHIVWNSQFQAQAYLDSVRLYHYDINSNLRSTITTAPAWSDMCNMGAWSNAICKMSIGASTDSLLVVTYTRFSPDDCSAGGFANGDIYWQYSYNGQSWSNPTNITNSPTTGCLPGECASEHWSSLAEKIDDNLHLFYVYDKDAGGIPQTEGTVTTNPMIYLRFPVNQLKAVEGNNALPDGFTLSQNYPNPFNAQTTIWYTLLNESNISLEIYDILGRRIAVLKEGWETEGSHSVVWDAKGAVSGLYFYRLSTGKGSIAQKMLLLK